MSGVRVARVDSPVVHALRARVLAVGRAGGAMSRDHAAKTRHWAAFVDDEVVGCVSVMWLRGWMLRGMAVAPELHRQGIGAQLIAAVYAEVAEPMWCNARLSAVPFYAAMGWVAVGPLFEMDEDGPHQRMTWTPPGT